ncbi:MAG: FMN-binding negative transcriptional regulator [Nitratireductor sp.]|nr:FMN-binding negative transcriptional regulator [Nitratireductor sp.]
MHPNPVFRRESERRNVDFARRRCFGTLAVNASPLGGDAPLISHIPFQLSPDGRRLEAHLVRSNPIVRLLETPQKAVIAVTEADGYISPDWYGLDDQVPTWNYVAVHLRGTLRRLPDEDLHGILVRLSAEMERRLLPKKPWGIDKMNPDAYARLLRMIVPVALDVETIDGTWKLSQNKPETARLAAAEGLAETGFGSEIDALAELMRGAGE